MSPPTSMNDMTKQNNFSQRSKQLSFTETINPELHPKKNCRMSHVSHKLEEAAHSLGRKTD